MIKVTKLDDHACLESTHLLSETSDFIITRFQLGDFLLDISSQLISNISLGLVLTLEPIEACFKKTILLD